MKQWSRDESLSLTLIIRSVSARDLYEYESQDKTILGYHVALVKNLYELLSTKHSLDLRWEIFLRLFTM